MNTWQYASGVMALFAALGLCVIVLHRGIHEGFLIKTGLIGLIFSLLITFALTVNETMILDYYWRATFLTKTSLFVTCLGLFVRARSYAKRERCEVDIPLGDEGLTRRIMRRITEPADDLAKLLNADSSPAPLEPHDPQKRSL